jgi:hypothetical protein
MARLITDGAELQTVAVGGPDAGFTIYGTPSIDLSNPRSGDAAYACDLTAASYEDVGFSFAGATATDYYARACIRLDALPTVQTVLMVINAGSANVGYVTVATDGTLGLGDAGHAIHPSTSIISPGVWYRLELHVRVGTTTANGTLELQRDGAAIVTLSGTANAGTAAPTTFLAGKCSAAASTVTGTILVDDIALNDGSGTSQNTWPGDGSILLLEPVADYARTGWTAGAGSTTNLWQAVDNTPPTGVALANATDTSQVKEANASSVEAYQPQLESYTDAGVDPAANIVLVQAVASHGNSTATARVHGLQIAQNPSGGGEATDDTGTTVAGIFPVGWSTFKTAVAYGSGGITPTGNPVLNLRKTAGDPDVAMFAFAGLLVEAQNPFGNAIQAADIQYHYSGGTTNIVPASSLGGAIATVLVVNDADQNLFADVTSDEASSGQTYYICLYIRNGNTGRTLESAVIWVDVTPTQGTIAIGLDSAAVGVTAASTAATVTTAPSPTITFSTPTTKGTGLAIGNIGPGQAKAIWVERVIPPGVSQGTDAFSLRVEGQSTY